MIATDGSGRGANKRGRRLAGLRLLLAEDMWIIAEAQKQVLQLEGATVVGPAATVAEAGALANEGTYDCAVFDIYLRGQMATDVINTLIARGVRVVVLSGSDIDASLRTKAAACLEKPVSEEQLVAAVAASVGR